MTAGPAYYENAPARAALAARAADTGLPLTELAPVLGLPLRTLHRVLGGVRLRWDTADRIAVALGYHPCELWPEWFNPTIQTEVAS
ncbi:MAG: Winged helix-turn-helix DNA-binding [Frankiales bacterium]|jgi:lambda repressor-like predicted transcriptional regulator|nr:Winged helix-turn-helix DNA-binding [Frankiales bacterium]